VTVLDEDAFERIIEKGLPPQEQAPTSKPKTKKKPRGEKQASKA